MHLLARLRSAARPDDGATLVETLVALVILGIAGVAILAGLQLSVMASDIHRKETADGAYVRGYAEAIEKYLTTNGNYVTCAGANAYRPSVVSYTVPTGHSAQQAAAVPLAGNGTTLACPGGDQGVQRLRLTVGSDDGRAIETLTIVVRRSCGVGDVMQLIRRLRALRSEEHGFTLPEMLITVIIMGIVAAGLAGVVISFLKTTIDTQSRLTESHDVQFAAAYWQRDVSSIGVRSYDSNSKSFPLQQSVNVTPACSLPIGTRVVSLAWSEYTSSDSTATPTTITVSYVAVPDTGGYNLLRTRCTGSTINSSFELMHSLNALPTVTCDIACTSANVPTVVSLNVSVLDPDGHGTTPYTASLSGERRQT